MDVLGRLETCGQIELVHVLAGARVHRKHDGDLLRHVDQRARDPLERLAHVDIRRPVHGQYRVLTMSQPILRGHVERLGPWQVHEQRVDHDVANPNDALFCLALGEQVLVGIG